MATHCLDLPIDAWHRLSPAEAIVGCGTRYIPEAFQPKEHEDLNPRIDGTWGPREYALLPQLWDPRSPYMSWIPLAPNDLQHLQPNGIMKFKMDKMHFTANTRCTRLGGLDKTIKAKFDGDVASLRERVHIAKFHAADLIRDPSAIQPPDVTLDRLDQVLVYLTLQDIYYRDCLEAVATLKRLVAELQGFVLWARDIGVRESIRRPYSVRGALVPDHRTYKTLVRLGIPTWIKVDLTRFIPPPQRFHVALSLFSDLCETRTWQELPLILDRTEMPFQPGKDGKLRLVHSKPLWYYPPRVSDASLFEKVARGLPGFSDLRLDIEIRDKRVDKEIRRLVKASG